MADFTEYEIRKAMDAVRNRHRPDSEVKDQLAQGDATNVHHIFSRSNYPDLRSTPENLILLTPQQHYTKAHPGNKTSVTDPDYQLDCLLSKLHSVRESEANSDAFYSKEGFVNVINNGFGLSLSSELSFDEIANRLRQYHQQS